jgi:hypothetical protein
MVSFQRLALTARLVGRTLLGIFREIGDENAYDRHLRSQGLAGSPAEWRRFWDNRLQSKYKQSKCC